MLSTVQFWSHMPSPDILHTTFSASASVRKPFTPVSEVVVGAGRRKAAVVEDGHDVRELDGQVAQLAHVLPLHVDAGDEAKLLEQCVSAVEVRVDEIVALREVS